MTFEEWCRSKVCYFIDSGHMDVEELELIYNLGFESGYNVGNKTGHNEGYAKALEDMKGVDFMSESGESGE